MKYLNEEMFAKLNVPKKDIIIAKSEKLRVVLNIMEAYDHLFYSFTDTGVQIATEDEPQLERLNKLLCSM